MLDHLTCLCQENQVPAALLAVIRDELVGQQLLLQVFWYVVLGKVELVEPAYQEVKGLGSAVKGVSVLCNALQ